MKKFLLSIVAIFTAITFISTPTYAAKKGDSCTCSDGSTGVVTVDTSILSACDCSGADGKGGNNSIMNLLNLIVDIMSIGVGILGVIGISIVGIQYLTAGGNEEQTRKAKRRLYEIIIGLAVYALIFALLKWLLPGFPDASKETKPEGTSFLNNTSISRQIDQDTH